MQLVGLVVFSMFSVQLDANNGCESIAAGEKLKIYRRDEGRPRASIQRCEREKRIPDTNIFLSTRIKYRCKLGTKATNGWFTIICFIELHTPSPPSPLSSPFTIVICDSISTREKIHHFSTFELGKVFSPFTFTWQTKKKKTGNERKRTPNQTNH